MKIKIPPLTKAEKILSLLNHWDPDNRSDAGYMAYNYEAETIAQHVRSNSKPETVEKAIYDVFSGTEAKLKDEEVKAMAQYIIAAVQSGKSGGKR